jgi:hypothetical protein
MQFMTAKQRKGEIRDPSPSGNQAPEQRDPDRHGESSTARATAKAIPEPRKVDVAGDDIPTNGEHNGTFYFLKSLTGDGEIPDSVHEDNKHEVIRMALNQGWRADEDTFRVHQAARTESGGWNVYYAVDVVRNEVQG